MTAFYQFGNIVFFCVTWVKLALQEVKVVYLL